jgi:hypothetical protein
MAIYAIHAEGMPHHVKFGRSDDPESRLKSFQTGNPMNLKLAAQCKGDVIAELAAHKLADHISHNHIRGEWWQMPQWVDYNEMLKCCYRSERMAKQNLETPVQTIRKNPETLYIGGHIDE